MYYYSPGLFVLKMYYHVKPLLEDTIFLNRSKYDQRNNEDDICYGRDELGAILSEDVFYDIDIENRRLTPLFKKTYQNSDEGKMRLAEIKAKDLFLRRMKYINQY